MAPADWHAQFGGYAGAAQGATGGGGIDPQSAAQVAALWARQPPPGASYNWIGQPGTDGGGQAPPPAPGRVGLNDPGARMALPGYGAAAQGAPAQGGGFFPGGGTVVPPGGYTPLSALGGGYGAAAQGTLAPPGGGGFFGTGGTVVNGPAPQGGYGAAAQGGLAPPGGATGALTAGTYLPPSQGGGGNPLTAGTYLPTAMGGLTAAQAMQQAQQGGGGMVTLIAPNGQSQQVPAAHVAHYLALGARQG